MLPVLWAGLALGGNLIAAPAKFQVEALSVAELLVVGRAQFAWLGVAELALAAAILLTLMLRRQRPGWLLLVAFAVFAVQQLGLQPRLQARSDLLIAGQAAGESVLHLVFIAAEIVKIGLLLCAGRSRA